MKTLEHGFYSYTKTKSYNVTNTHLIENNDKIDFNIIHLENCYYNNYCFINSKYIISIVSQRHHIYNSTVLKCYNNKQVDEPIINEQKLYLWNANTNNYLHFIRESILVLNEFINDKKYASFKILIFNNKLPPFVIDILQTLNLYNKLIFIKDISKNNLRNILFKNLHIPIFNNIELSKRSYYDYKIVKELKKHIDMYKLPEQLKYNKIYVSRRTWTRNNNSNVGQDNTQIRKCINEDKLVEILSQCGYKEIFLEDYNFAEKINILNYSEKVITTYGAGIINFLYTKNTNYYIFNSEYYHMNRDINNTINNYNKTHIYNCYTHHVDPSNNSTNNTNNTKWKLDINEVNKLLDLF